MEDSVVEMNESLDLDSEHLQALIHETDALKATEASALKSITNLQKQILEIEHAITAAEEEIAPLGQEVDKLTSAVYSKNCMSTDLSNTIADNRQQFESANKMIVEIGSKLAETEAPLKKFREKLERDEECIRNGTERIHFEMNIVKNNINCLQKAVIDGKNRQQAQKDTLDRRHLELQSEIEEKVKERAGFEKCIEDIKLNIDKITKEHEKLQAQIGMAEEEIGTKQAEIETAKKEIENEKEKYEGEKAAIELKISEAENTKALDLELLKQIKDKILSEDNRLEECDKSLKDVEAKYKDKRTHCETLQKELENLKSNPLEDEHNRMKALKEELKSILQEVNTLKTLSTTIKSQIAEEAGMRNYNNWEINELKTLCANFKSAQEEIIKQIDDTKGEIALQTDLLFKVKEQVAILCGKQEMLVAQDEDNSKAANSEIAEMTEKADKEVALMQLEIKEVAEQMNNTKAQFDLVFESAHSIHKTTVSQLNNELEKLAEEKKRFMEETTNNNTIAKDLLLEVEMLKTDLNLSSQKSAVDPRTMEFRLPLLPRKRCYDSFSDSSAEGGGYTPRQLLSMQSGRGRKRSNKKSK